MVKVTLVKKDADTRLGMAVDIADATKMIVDKVWLAAVVDAAITEALKPYALIDFGTHTDDLP